MRRSNNEESPYFIVDRQDWQRRNKYLTRDPEETQGTLVLVMINGGGMAVDRHREGKEAEAAEKPYNGKTTCHEDSVVVLHGRIS